MHDYPPPIPTRKKEQIHIPVHEGDYISDNKCVVTVWWNVRYHKSFSFNWRRSNEFHPCMYVDPYHILFLLKSVSSPTRIIWNVFSGNYKRKEIFISEFIPVSVLELCPLIFLEMSAYFSGKRWQPYLSCTILLVYCSLPLIIYVGGWYFHDKAYKTIKQKANIWKRTLKCLKPHIK